MQPMHENVKEFLLKCTLRPENIASISLKVVQKLIHEI